MYCCAMLMLNLLRNGAKVMLNLLRCSVVLWGDAEFVWDSANKMLNLLGMVI